MLVSTYQEDLFTLPYSQVPFMLAPTMAQSDGPNYDRAKSYQLTRNVSNAKHAGRGSN